jgi:hypothetical protein
MALTCNINRRGRLARLIFGIVVAAMGVFLIFAWAIGSASVGRWVTCVAVVLGGLFSIFEATVGWCAVRAIGLKTPM